MITCFLFFLMLATLQTSSPYRSSTLTEPVAASRYLNLHTVPAD